MTCAHSEDRSAWASAQSDQSLRCPHEKNIEPLTTFKTDQTERMPRLIWVFAGRTCHFVGFVMRWLIYFRSRTEKKKKENTNYLSIVEGITTLTYLFYIQQIVKNTLNDTDNVSD